MPNFELKFSTHFVRKFKALAKKDLRFIGKVDATLYLRRADPQNSTLKSHKVRDSDGKIAFSSKVTGDIRIIWDYRARQAYVLDILDIGGHSGKGKV